MPGRGRKRFNRKSVIADSINQVIKANATGLNISKGTAQISTSAAAADDWEFRDPQVGDIFVNADSGTDDLAGDRGSESNPFKTLDFAIAQWTSGQAIWLRQTTADYSMSDLTGSSPDGTAANWVVVSGYPGELPVVDTTINTGIQLDAVSYWWFRNFKATFTGTWHEIGSTALCEHLRYTDMTGVQSAGGCNRGFVRTYLRCNYLEIIRGTFVGAGSGQNNNTAMFNLFDNNTVKIIGVDARDVMRTLYLKHPNDNIEPVDIIIANNVWVDPVNELFSNFAQTEMYDNLVIQNGSEDDVAFGSANGGRAANAVNRGKDSILEHNTFVNTGFSIEDPNATGITCNYNIVEGRYKLLRYDPDPIEHSGNYNLLGSSIWREDSSAMSLSIYQAQTWSDGSRQEQNSIAGNPTFVGSPPSDTVYTDWALHPSSLGYQAAPDGTDLGCDTSLLGTTNKRGGGKYTTF